MFLYRKDSVLKFFPAKIGFFNVQKEGGLTSVHTGVYLLMWSVEKLIDIEFLL
jgi:hypothetical protein